MVALRLLRLPWIFAVVLTWGFACATSPTGRKQLILLPDSQMDALGSQAFLQMKASEKVEKDPKINAYVRCVAMPIAEEAKGELQIKEWEIVVFQEQSANAFALPGGKIGVHTGILKVAKTPSQLAAVLGHEVGHVIARHGNERVSQGLAAQGVLATAGALAKESPHRNLILGGLGLGAQFGILLPFSRTQESEADLIGLDLMSSAGFNPRESVDLWKNMSETGGDAPPEFLSTHPSHETRISNLQAHIPESLLKYEKAQAAGKKPTCHL